MKKVLFIISILCLGCAVHMPGTPINPIPIKPPIDVFATHDTIIITKIDTLKGEPGKDGYTPRKGVDYFDGKDGKDGRDGKEGLPGKDGINGKDGKEGLGLIIEVMDHDYVDSQIIRLQVQLSSIQFTSIPALHNEIKNISPVLTDEQITKIIASIHIPAIQIGIKSLRDFGAIPDDGIDDADATQTAVDYYINHAYSWLTFERGKYLWSHEIKLEVPNGFVFLSLRGDGNSFDPENNKGAGTLIKLTNKMTYAIGIEGGKGCRVDDFNIQGMNTGLLNYSYADVVNEKDDFNPDGCLDTRHALHAAIVIDPDYRANKSGSTGIKVTNCYMSSFIGGVIISPAGTQNGEACVFTNIWADHMKVCFSSGDVQNRTNYIIHFINWGCTKTSFSSADYGGVGCPFIVQGANFAGGNKEIYHTGGWFGNTEHGSDFHAEEMYRIQRSETRGAVVILDVCNIDLMGEHEGVRLPSQIVQCKTFVMNGGRIVYYGKNQSIIGLSVDHAIFNNMQTNCPFITTNGDIKYNNVDMGLEKNINEPPLQGTSVTGTKVLSIDGDEWTFESSNKMNVGDFVGLWKGSIKSEFDFGNPMTIGAGVVQSIVGNTITVKGVPFGIIKGQDLDITTYKIMK